MQTEKRYFEALKVWRHNAAVKVTVLPKACSPIELVRYAERWLDRNDADFDEVWCVFDVDEFPDVEAAMRQARKCSVAVAVSNPCFELWLRLHFETVHKAQSRCDPLTRRVRTHLPGYTRSRFDTAPEPVHRGLAVGAEIRSMRTPPDGTGPCCDGSRQV